MELKQGYNLVFANRGFYSWAIRKMTKSKWTHAGTIYDNQEADGHVIVAEALEDGFKKHKHEISKLEKMARNGRLLVRKVPDNIKTYSPTLVINRYIGIKYGKIQVFFNALSILFKRQIKGDKDKTFTCSEGVQVCNKEMTYGKVDIAKEFGVTQDYVYPCHIARSVQLIDVIQSE